MDSLSSLLPSLNSVVKDMSPKLTTPKRLFDTHLMKTVMYEDAVDLEEHGYVAISHVWGDQRKYVPKCVGVIDGVTWTIPLSNPDKMQRVEDAMLQYKKRYCWFDVLCLPQNKQEEVNEEIPFMGDYYAGADMVLVLATIDPVISEKFAKWYDIMEDVVKKKRDFTKKERKWILSYEGLNSFDISEEKWFTRLWTFQEAIMAKKLVLVCNNGMLVNLFDIGKKISKMARLDIRSNALFNTSGDIFMNIRMVRNNRLGGVLDLVQVMSRCSNRDCFKPQDKFYGALGVLGYKDFPINYDISMKDLNEAVVKYAFSKGDISWLSVGGDEGTGFIQPMYKPFVYVGWVLKEDIPGICGIRLEDEIMYINAWSFAKVVCHKKVVKGDNINKFNENKYRIFKKWGLYSKDIVKHFVQYKAMSNDEVEVAEAYFEQRIGNDEVAKSTKAKFGIDVYYKYLRSLDAKITIIKATTWENKDIPLTVYGNAEKDDQIMLTRMTDYENCRALGIVVDKYFRRKGVCVYEKIKMTEEEAISRFTPQEFPL